MLPGNHPRSWSGSPRLATRTVIVRSLGVRVAMVEAVPTGGYARAYSGIGLESFMKRISYQEISEDGLTNLGPTIQIMAEEEELMAHSIAVQIRLRKLTENF